jgi:hypothetical protein
MRRTFLIALLVVLAACSGDSAGNRTAASNSPTTTSGSATTTTAAGDTTTTSAPGDASTTSTTAAATSTSQGSTTTGGNGGPSTTAGTSGSTSTTLALTAPTPPPTGTDPQLPNAHDLAVKCHDGDMQACDDLYDGSTAASEYETYGNTCGGRLPNDNTEYCVDVFGPGIPS